MRAVAIGAAATAALALAAPAAAHVVVRPMQVAPLTAVRFVFTVPNERPRGSIVGLRLSLPPGLVLGEAELLAGWSARTTAHQVVWRGGPIPPGQFAAFSLLATASGRHTVLPIAAEERYADGTVERFRPTVTVVRATATPTRARVGHDSGARTLGGFALAFAIAALALALAGGFGFLWVWLRLPR